MNKKILCMFIVFTIAFRPFFSSTIKPLAYHNHCWNCKSDISSEYCAKCPDCGWYICRSCGRCSKGCDRNHNDSFFSTGNLVLFGVIGIMLLGAAYSGYVDNENKSKK